MRKKKITRQFKNFKIYKDLYGKTFKHDWVAKVVFLIQMLLTGGGRCNSYFRGIIRGIRGIQMLLTEGGRCNSYF